MKKLKWIKKDGPYSEEYLELPSGRKYKIGICDDKIYLATKTKNKDWYLIYIQPYKKGMLKHVKNLVKIIVNEPLLKQCKDKVSMPDICMCDNDNCPRKLTCYRYVAVPDTYQSYFSEDPREEDGSCKHYYDIELPK